MESSVTFRELSTIDCDPLWSIRNHPDVRKVALDASEIPLSHHRVWFKQYLEKPNKLAIVAVVNERTVGYCRIDDGLVSIAVHPDYHGLGFGRQLLIETLHRAGHRWPIVTAEVLAENISSINLFKRAGFSLARTEINKQVFEWQPLTT